MRSSRSSRWASANWIRSCGVSGGSSPAWSRRYWFTQLPSVPSFTPSSRATWAIGRDPSITSRTASSRNSGLNLRYFLAIPCITFRARSYWIVVREQRGTSLRPTLLAHLDQYPPGQHGLVFANQVGKPLRRTLFRRRVWRPALVRAGLLGHLNQTGANRYLAGWTDDTGAKLTKEFATEPAAVACIVEH